MKILLLGHPDIASVYAVDRVIRKLPHCEFSVCLSPGGASKSVPHPALRELAATDQQLLRAFMSGGYCDRLPAREIRNSTELSHPNSAEALDKLRAIAPDLIVSVRYRRILKEDCISLPKHGVINLHSGLLPDYRGVMATFWAMLAGESTIGSTLHRIVDSGIDTGPLISRQIQARDPALSYLSNVLGLYRCGTDAIVSTVNDLQNLRKIPFLPTGEGGHYYSEPGRDAVQEFLQAGGRLVDESEETLVRTLISSSD